MKGLREVCGKITEVRWCEMGALALGAMGVALWFSLEAPGGLPMDDAYIHLAHARALLERGELTILPEVHSQALTSPLWTLLLGAAYLFTKNGGQAVALLALLVLPFLALGVWALLMSGGFRRWVPWFGGLLSAMTGPLVWLNASGMESVLFAALLVWACWALGRRRGWLAGLFGGASVLTRIEGVVLLVPAGFVAIREVMRKGKGDLWWLPALGVPVVTLGGFVVFNFVAFGRLLPGTLWAKRFAHGLLGPPSLGDAWLLVEGWVRYMRLGLLEVTGLSGCGWVLGGLWVCGVIGMVGNPSSGLVSLLITTLLIDALYLVLLPAQGAAGRYQVLNWLWPPILVALGLGYICSSVERLIRSRWSLLARLATVVLGVFAFAVFGRALQAWRVAYEGNVQQIQEAHVRASEALVTVNSGCLPVLAYDIGALAYTIVTPKCVPRLVDLGGMLDPSLLEDLRGPNAIQNLVVRYGGDAFLLLPTTLDGRPLCPPLGLEVQGPPGDRKLIDPSGMIEIRPVAAMAARISNPYRWLVEANAPRVGVWRVMVRGFGDGPGGSKE